MIIHIYREQRHCPIFIARCYFYFEKRGEISSPPFPPPPLSLLLELKNRVQRRYYFAYMCVRVSCCYQDGTFKIFLSLSETASERSEFIVPTDIRYTIRSLVFCSKNSKIFFPSLELNRNEKYSTRRRKER